MRSCAFIVKTKVCPRFDMPIFYWDLSSLVTLLLNLSQPHTISGIIHGLFHVKKCSKRCKSPQNCLSFINYFETYPPPKLFNKIILWDPFSFFLQFNLPYFCPSDKVETKGYRHLIIYNKAHLS